MAAGPSVPSVPVMSLSASPSSSPTARPSVPFESILCGVDGGRGAAEAARQAAILAAAGARLTLLGVGWDTGQGLAARAAIAPTRLAHALEKARREARERGVAATVETLEDPDATATLLAEAAHHDLLAVGASASSRAGGMLAGSTDSAAVHSAPVPVLLARRPPAGVEFPASILAAIDGTPASAGVAATAAALARAHGAHVSVVAPPGLDAREHERLVDAIATIADATGSHPVVLDEHASAHKAITAAAASVGAALVVIGSRGLHGVHALSSVSERVAHEAPCSVIVLRPAKGSVES
jgi:nucleotide-binding universal stress UspA family protein